MKSSLRHRLRHLSVTAICVVSGAGRSIACNSLMRPEGRLLPLTLPLCTWIHYIHNNRATYVVFKRTGRRTVRPSTHRPDCPADCPTYLTCQISRTVRRTVQPSEHNFTIYVTLLMPTTPEGWLPESGLLASGLGARYRITTWQTWINMRAQSSALVESHEV